MRLPLFFDVDIQDISAIVLLLLLLLQVLIDATSRPAFAILDLTAGMSGASRPAVIADMPLDSTQQHVYAVSSTRVSEASSKHLYQLTLQSCVIVRIRGLSYHFLSHFCYVVFQAHGHGRPGSREQLPTNLCFAPAPPSTKYFKTCTILAAINIIMCGNLSSFRLKNLPPPQKKMWVATCLLYLEFPSF